VRFFHCFTLKKNKKPYASIDAEAEITHFEKKKHGVGDICVHKAEYDRRIRDKSISNMHAI
jgi:hypothetical protein